jgi:hypothetical protein
MRIGFFHKRERAEGESRVAHHTPYMWPTTAGDRLNREPPRSVFEGLALSGAGASFHSVPGLVYTPASA